MTRPQVGGRAVAVRNADQDTVYLFGYGTYLGPRPLMSAEFDPDTEWDGGKSMRDIQTEIAAAQCAQPRTEYITTDGRRSGKDQYGYALDEDWPVDRRVAASLAYFATGECIQVEGADGAPAGFVYGNQCW